MITIRELLNSKRNLNLYNIFVFDDEDVCWFNYELEEHRHPDDGSYANVWHHIPDGVLNMPVDDWTIERVAGEWDTIMILSAR